MLHVSVQLISDVIAGDAVKVDADLHIENAAISCRKHRKFCCQMVAVALTWLLLTLKGPGPSTGTMFSCRQEALPLRIPGSCRPLPS